MNIAIILAAGSGTRMGNVNVLKQFLNLYNKPLLIHTLEVFEIHPDIDEIVIVTNKEYIDEVSLWVKQYDLTKVNHIVQGGATRQASVYAGLVTLSSTVQDRDIVLIHDAARPLLSSRIIKENVEATKQYGAVDTVIPSTDTIIKSMDAQTIASIPLRKELYCGQTPQSFQFSLLWQAHQQALQMHIEDASDDCQLVMRNGQTVHLVQGDRMNFKVTTFDDFMMVKALVRMGRSEGV